MSNKGLRLTEQLADVGCFILPEHEFTTDDGFLIEFEYIMQGNNELTDGICMFLMDPSAYTYSGTDIIKFGAEGAGFGYTHKMAKEVLDRRLGIKGGYIAVALDQGPFKANRMEDWEMRNGIIYTDIGYLPPAGSQLTRYNTRSNVTIRGAAGNQVRTFTSKYQNIPVAYWGFPVLVTRHTGWSVENENRDPQDLKNDVGFKLNTNDGDFIKHVVPEIKEAFNIAGGADFKSPEDAAYRKMIIVLEPNPDTNKGGYKITVHIKHGNTITPVIEGFEYPKTLTYRESSLSARWPDYAANFNEPPLSTYTVERPNKLIIGFSASTGILTPYTNYIRNLRITPAYAANTANDDIRDHRRGPVTIRPFDNDEGCKKEGNEIIRDKDFLDPNSFRFWSDEKHLLSGFEHTDTNGKWVYNPATAEVLFFPNEGFKGEATIMYDVKGAYYPYNDDKHRSSLATILVEIKDVQP